MGIEGQIERQKQKRRASDEGRRGKTRTDKGNISPVTECKKRSSKTDSNWVFDGQKETHRRILKMAH